MSKSKIEETLDRHIGNKEVSEALVITSVKDGVKHYQINITNLINYIRDFEQIKSKA